MAAAAAGGPRVVLVSGLSCKYLQEDLGSLKMALCGSFPEDFLQIEPSGCFRLNLRPVLLR